MIRSISLLVVIAAMAPGTWAAETDQFLTWDIELEDSAGPINEYLNTEIQEVLDAINRRQDNPCDGEQVVRRIYLHLFKGLHASKFRDWLNHSGDIDRYPKTEEVSYNKHYMKSVYRRRSFPYILPMARTIRVGDIYFGIDKIGHFFGFGRRYYAWYRDLRAQGLGEEEAMRRVVIRGIGWENTVVGKLVDGIFSHADLEADYQGARMAKDLCEGENPYLVMKDGKWTLSRPIDLRLYVTPDFDESYNTNHYWALRKKFVLPLLTKKYRHKAPSPPVQERFERYRQWEPSFSKRIVDEFFATRGEDPQRKQLVEALGPDAPQMKRASTQSKLTLADEAG